MAEDPLLETGIIPEIIRKYRRQDMTHKMKEGDLMSGMNHTTGVTHTTGMTRKNTEENHPLTNKDMTLQVQEEDLINCLQIETKVLSMTLNPRVLRMLTRLNPVSWNI